MFKMQPNMFCLCVAASILLVAQATSSCFRLSGAVNYNGKVFLVNRDNKAIEIDGTFSEVGASRLSTIFAGFDGELDASLIDPADNKLYFFQGNYYFEYSSISNSFGGPKKNEYWSDFFVGGIDAASSLGSKSYYFKGCQYRTGEVGGQAAATSTLGLPCDVDAAFEMHGMMFVTRGNNVWGMSSDGTVSPSQPLSNLLTLTSTSICDEPMNPFTSKIRTEQAYEKKNKCVVIDAAINWYDEFYLFNNDKYISIGSSGNEEWESDAADWSGLAGDIDASVVWSGDGETYFFKGPSYFQYKRVGWSYINKGPVSNARWGGFFADGIDASGNFGGTSYFFKDCQVLKMGRTLGIGKPLKSADLGLPCNVDAAFNKGKDLHVIKRNQVWTWKAGSAKATGPADLSTVASLSSWTVCPPA